MNSQIANAPYEFSSLATWNNNVLLVPALNNEDARKPVTPLIYVVSNAELDKSLQSTPHKVKKYSTINFDKASFKKITDLNGYDGIEATVVINSTIYFSIESGGNECYIGKGRIATNAQGLPTIFMEKFIPLAKSETRKFISNDGFESLAYVNGKLVAVFEKNDLNEKEAYYEISLDLLEISELKTKTGFPEFRLTDITAINGELYGVNSTFDNDNPARFKYVIVRIGDSAI